MSRANKIAFFILILFPSFSWSFTFHFSTTEDKETCQSLVFKKVSQYRRVSTEEMSRKSADQCCRMRGMTLYSVEKVDEPKKFTTQFSSKLGADAGKWFWASANNIREKARFRWEYGQLVDSNAKRSKMWDPHVWDDKQPDPSGRCTLIKVQGDKVVMKVADCDKDSNPFVCELEPQGRGKDLDLLEISTCSQSKVQSLPGFPSLKIFEYQGRWPMANFCCQQRGWSLVDDVVGKGKKFYQSVSSHDWGLAVSGQPTIQLWTSGNDLQQYGQWQWACGDDVVTDLNWLAPNPDNKEGNEHCIMYKDPDEATFQADDVNCNTPGVIICESSPKCTTDEQYPRGAKDPRRYDLYDDLEEDAKTCETVKFTETVGNQTDNSDYPNVFYVSDKNLSWAGGEACCQENNMSYVILGGPPDVSRFQDIMNVLAYETPSNFKPKTLWTGATNWVDSLRARMKWANGVYIKTYIADPTVIHDEIYPICGIYTYVSPRGYYLISSNCLEKHKFVCTKRNESYPASGSMMMMAASISESDVPSADEAHDILYNKSLAVLTVQEQEYKVVVVSRDKCSKGNILEDYHAVCPKSSSDIAPFQKVKKNVTDEEKYKINLQNKRMLKTLINSGVFGYTVEQHAPKFGFELLSVSTDIYSKICPIVPSEFVQMAFKLFHDLHWMTSQGRTDILKETEYKWILKLLTKCSKLVKPVHARTDKCGEEFIAKDNCTNFVCTSPMFEFKLYRTDPLMDIIWKIYEMIHSVCFPFFEESYRMYHKYAQGVMDLFSYELKLRWFNPLADNDFWTRILGPSYDLHLVNMERCNQASIMSSFFHIRLARHTVPDRVRVIGGREYKYKYNL